MTTPNYQLLLFMGELHPLAELFPLPPTCIDLEGKQAQFQCCSEKRITGVEDESCRTIDSWDYKWFRSDDCVYFKNNYELFQATDRWAIAL